MSGSYSSVDWVLSYFHCVNIYLFYHCVFGVFLYICYIVLSMGWTRIWRYQNQSGPIFLQCFDTVGLVILLAKPVPVMCLVGRYNLTQFQFLPHKWLRRICDSWFLQILLLTYTYLRFLLVCHTRLSTTGDRTLLVPAFRAWTGLLQCHFIPLLWCLRSGVFIVGHINCSCYLLTYRHVIPAMFLYNIRRILLIPTIF